MNPNSLNIDFREIEFGDSDAQTEVSTTPELLTKGFLDPIEMVDTALNRRDFLFLGSKGSGKSALSEHIRLLSSSDDKISVSSMLLNEFPYKLFAKIVKGGAENEAKFQIAWRFILLLYVFDSLNNDVECQHTKVDEWTEVVNLFYSKSLFPIRNVSDIVHKTSKKTFSIGIELLKAQFELTSETNDDINAVSEYLKSLIGTVRTSKKHYLVIDGLDETLTNRIEQEKSVISLINQAKEINNWCRREGISFKVIVLCRTDIFERLSDPNKNKLKTDFAFPIKWFDESETDNDRSSALIQLANLRCKLKYNDIEDMFETFFPESYDGKPIRKVLLDYTRHTPRDFLQLLKKIQKSCQGNIVNKEDITRGLKKYSLDYFKDEIKDELSGYFSSEDIELIFQLLCQLRQRDFKFSDVIKLCEKNPQYNKVNWIEAFSCLFSKRPTTY